MKRTFVALVAVLATLGMVPSTTGAALTATIENTGPDSENVIRVGGGHRGLRVEIRNNNDINLEVDTDQEAYSGNAVVSYNTDGGDAESGDAHNENGVAADVVVSNNNDGYGGCGDCGGGDVDASISNTGPYSTNKIIVGGGSGCGGGCGGSGYSVRNDNDVDLDVDTDQEASSGNAKVYKNTNGGDATSGDAHNENDTDVEVEIENNGYHGSGCDGCGSDVDASIDTTGPKSYNRISVGDDCSCRGRSGRSVRNNNNVSLSNSTSQSAHSGNARVSGNTNAGSAHSGNASNSNSSSFSVSINN